jgi:hypothetical protein
MEAGMFEEACKGAMTFCVLLESVGRDDLNDEFAVFLIRMGKELKSPDLIVSILTSSRLTIRYLAMNFCWRMLKRRVCAHI